MNTGDRRRIIVIASVGGALIVLFALAKFVLFKSDSGSKSTATTLSTVGTAPAGGLTGTSEASRSTSPPATFDVFATKNPFEPVIIVTPTDGTGGTTPTTPTTDGTGNTTPTSSPTGTGGSTTTTSTPSVEPGPGTSVALLDVFHASGGATEAKVQVGSTVYTVGVGDVFATSYRVVSLSGQCGQFVFGDAPFKLCEGEEVIK